MSTIKLIKEERAATIGKFMVGRLLPFRQKRMVGSFIYIDHMGPVKLSERENCCKDRIKESKQKWKDQSFAKIKGDETEFIPYPSFK